MSPGWRFLPAGPSHADEEPDWKQAKPASIAKALQHALAKPTGGWYALDASRRIGTKPRVYRVAGRDVVAWRVDGELCVAPDACPHMGATLGAARVCEGKLVCPWHGLALGREGHGAWKLLHTHDDGVLVWIRFAKGDVISAPWWGAAAVDPDTHPGEPLGRDEPTESPILPVRPALYLEGVVRIEARCAPEDVIANRLDPWHGAHFHPYSFGALRVLEETDDCLTVRVEKRILGSVRVEVDATFHCPDARTIVMTILDGEGKGSIVETHATPMEPGRTAIVEATLATSQRPGFKHAQKVRGLIRPLIERSARRLWVDDAAYAERAYQLRERVTDTWSG